MRVIALLGTALLAAGAGAAQDSTTRAEGALSEDEKIVHVLNRLTPGATSALVDEVRKVGLKAWLERQLKGDPKGEVKGEVRETDDFLARVRRLESLGLNGHELFVKYDKEPPPSANEKTKTEARQWQETPTRELMTWVLWRAVYSQNHVKEVLSDFYRNHFSVSVEKDEIKYLALDWERQVIRRHAGGSFGAMLEESAHHSAMLIYLDNHVSRRPPSNSELKQIEAETRRQTKSRDRAKEAVDIARQRGLNENYARELLELHTLGVDRYYTQADVIALAKVLTGWTLKREGPDRFTFEFNGDMHAQDNKLFLGLQLHGKRDTSEGDFALTTLQRHPGTGRFLAWKLCRWLVNDEPDEKMVKRVGDVFTRTNGYMPRVIQAIVDDPDFFARDNFRAKFKRPWELVVSAMRVTGADVEEFAGIGGALAGMNEALYRCPDPTGYYDQAEAWRDPGTMAVRWTFINEFVHGRVKGVKIPDAFWSSLPADPRQCKTALVDRVLPVAGVGPRTSSALDKIVARHPKAGPALGRELLAVLLGSPEFQRQ